MSEPVILCEHVTKAFPFCRVLHDVDLTIPRGAIVGLLGTNGSGKSTLIKCLLGLLKIDAGTARVLGEDPWKLTADAKSRLGYVPQDIQLYPWLNVDQMIRYTGSYFPTWDQQRCFSLMQSWQLDALQLVKNLSGGQLQRLALILAMGHRPELLILDEPAAALDPVGRRSFLRSLLEMNEEGKQTVLFSTHITSDLERVATHVAFLHEGKIQFFGELEELKDRVGGNLEDIFLEMHNG